MKKEITKLTLNKKPISNLHVLGATQLPGVKKANNQFVDGQTKRGIECFTHKCHPSW
jgi:hypothetical protein